MAEFQSHSYHYVISDQADEQDVASLALIVNISHLNFSSKQEGNQRAEALRNGEWMLGNDEKWPHHYLWTMSGRYEQFILQSLISK